MSPVRPDEPETPIVEPKVLDLMAALKKSLGERGELIAQTKRPDLLDELQEAVRAEQDAGVCKRCGRKTGFDFDDTGELVSQCCGWPPVAADRDPS